MNEDLTDVELVRGSGRHAWNVECIPLLHFHDSHTLHQSQCAVQLARQGCSICSVPSNKQNQDTKYHYKMAQIMYCKRWDLHQPWFRGWRCTSCRNARSTCSCTVSNGRRRSSLWLHINWSKTKIVQFCNPATLFNSPGGRWTGSGRLLHLSWEHNWFLWWQQRRDHASDRIGMELHEPPGKKDLEI